LSFSLGPERPTALITACGVPQNPDTLSAESAERAKAAAAAALQQLGLNNNPFAALAEASTASSMETDGAPPPAAAAGPSKPSLKARLRAELTALEQQKAALTERNAALESALEAAQLKHAEYESIIGRSDSEQVQLKSAEQLMKFLPKPMQFDGVNKFTEFRAQMQLYLSSVNLPTRFEAHVAVAYLTGTALQWWTQLHITTPMPDSWEALQTLMNSRFDHLNPEMAARSKLQSLKQGNLSVHAYLKEFEGCYAHIPAADEKDKVFRFTFGLNSNLRDKFAVNPTTHRVWESFTALVAYITNFVADTPAASGAITDAVRDKPSNGTSQTNGSKGNLKAKGGITKPQKKRGMSADKAAKPAKPMANKNGQPVTRSNAVKSFCMKEKLCLGCFKKGHMVADCTTAPVSGTPPDFSA
jgi:hypothetical protein